MYNNILNTVREVLLAKLKKSNVLGILTLDLLFRIILNVLNTLNNETVRCESTYFMGRGNRDSDNSHVGPSAWSNSGVFLHLEKVKN